MKDAFQDKTGIVVRNAIADDNWKQVDIMLRKSEDKHYSEDEDEDEDEGTFLDYYKLKNNIEMNGRFQNCIRHVFLSKLEEKAKKVRHKFDILKINAKITDREKTPLHFAAHFRKVKACVALLLLGADATIKDINGLTPGDYALKKGYDILGHSLKNVEVRQSIQHKILKKIIPIGITDRLEIQLLREISSYLFQPLALKGKKIVGRDNDSECQGFHIWVGFKLKSFKEKKNKDPYNFTKNKNNPNEPKTQAELNLFQACKDLDVTLLKKTVNRINMVESDEVSEIKWNWNRTLNQYTAGTMQPYKYRLFLSYGYEKENLQELLMGESESSSIEEGKKQELKHIDFQLVGNFLDLFIMRIFAIDGFVTNENIDKIIEFMTILIENCNMDCSNLIKTLIRMKSNGIEDQQVTDDETEDVDDDITNEKIHFLNDIETQFPVFFSKITDWSEKQKKKQKEEEDQIKKEAISEMKFFDSMLSDL